MALIIKTTPGNDGFDMRTVNFDAFIEGKSVTAFNPFVVQWKPATGTDTVTLFGDNLVPGVSGGTLQSLTGTMITQLFVTTTAFAFNAAGMTLSVDRFTDLVDAQDWRGLAEAMRAGNDSIVGTKNDDTLLGGLGDDKFTSSAGRDLMFGGAGEDTLLAMGGHDVMTGGRGSDYFAFEAEPEAGDGNSVTIKDFRHGVDRISVSDVGFNHVGFGGFDGAALEAVHFGYGKQAKSADQGLIYDKAKGFLYYDADGSGTQADKVLFARLGADTDLSFQDFWVV